MKLRYAFAFVLIAAVMLAASKSWEEVKLTPSQQGLFEAGYSEQSIPSGCVIWVDRGGQSLTIYAHEVKEQGTRTRRVDQEIHIYKPGTKPTDFVQYLSAQELIRGRWYYLNEEDAWNVFAQSYSQDTGELPEKVKALFRGRYNIK